MGGVADAPIGVATPWIAAIVFVQAVLFSYLDVRG